MSKFSLKDKFERLWKSFTFHLLCCTLFQQLVSAYRAGQLTVLWYQADLFVSHYFHTMLMLPLFIWLSFFYDMTLYVYCFSIYWTHTTDQVRSAIPRRMQLLHLSVQLLCSALALCLVGLIARIEWLDAHTNALDSLYDCMARGKCVTHDFVSLIMVFNSSYYRNLPCPPTNRSNAFNGSNSLRLLGGNKDTLACVSYRYKRDCVSCLGNLLVNHVSLCGMLLVYILSQKLKLVMLQHTEEKLTTWYARGELQTRWKQILANQYEQMVQRVQKLTNRFARETQNKDKATWSTGSVRTFVSKPYRFTTRELPWLQWWSSFSNLLRQTFHQATTETQKAYDTPPTLLDLFEHQSTPSNYWDAEDKFSGDSLERFTYESVSSYVPVDFGIYRQLSRLSSYQSRRTPWLVARYGLDYDKRFNSYGTI